ncbi:MAG TPA: hypothetical protein VLW52_14775 [Opitutaceae bacterium]|nr:hypothetical protein [Opitutaceae bacterium]
MKAWAILNRNFTSRTVAAEAFAPANGGPTFGVESDEALPVAEIAELPRADFEAARLFTLKVSGNVGPGTGCVTVQVAPPSTL